MNHYEIERQELIAKRDAAARSIGTHLTLLFSLPVAAAIALGVLFLVEGLAGIIAICIAAAHALVTLVCSGIMLPLNAARYGRAAHQLREIDARRGLPEARIVVR